MVDLMSEEREPEVLCKICEKSIYRIFVEHIEEHLKHYSFKKLEEKKGGE